MPRKKTTPAVDKLTAGDTYDATRRGAPIQQGSFTNAPGTALQSGGVKTSSRPGRVKNPPLSHSGNTRKARGINLKLRGRGTKSIGKVK